MIETMSSNKTLLQLSLVLKIKDLKPEVRRFNLNYIKSIKINSGRAIQNLVRAISAHAALPLGRPKPSFSWFERVTAQARAIARMSCQGLHLLSLMIEFPIVKLITFHSENSSQKILFSDKFSFQLSNYSDVPEQVKCLTHPLNPCVACTLCQYMSTSLTHHFTNWFPSSTDKTWHHWGSKPPPPLKF